jgi:hypothetical protein
LIPKTLNFDLTPALVQIFGACGEDTGVVSGWVKVNIQAIEKAQSSTLCTSSNEKFARTVAIQKSQWVYLGDEVETL